MYQQVYQILSDRLTELGFANVANAFGKPPALPAVQPFLAEDKLLDAQPVEHRELLWYVQFTIANDATTGAAQTKAHSLLNTARQGLYRWHPSDRRGFNGPFNLTEIKLADYQLHDSIIYLASVSVRVYPSKFA